MEACLNPHNIVFNNMELWDTISIVDFNNSQILNCMSLPDGLEQNNVFQIYGLVFKTCNEESSYNFSKSTSVTLPRGGL